MRMLRALLLCGVVGVATTLPTSPDDEVTPRAGEKCGYDSCTDASPDLLNVHIVAHTHDDVGWLKTVDQYYYGSRNNIQKAGVKYILDSVVKELWEDPKRKFIYVETAFFWKWWVAQPAAVRSRVHALVRQGRLQFVGGAWSMNDEAATYYQSTIDQFTWGLRKLNETFGACGRPAVGWQIDPFGHSREFAAALALAGYDALFLGRIDYQDKARRLRDRAMEMLWRGSDDLGKPTDIFTGVLYNTYSPPPGFCFDVLCSDEPIIDDPSSPMFNVDERVTDFLEYVLEEAKHYRTNNVIVTMGGDFTYQDAFMWFDNLDKLIKHANLKAGKEGLNIKLFYSTPQCYLKAVKDANPTLPIKQDDFFPYASDPTAFWTGYFTSRPTTKFMEREGNNYLQTFKMLQVLANLPKTNMFVLNELKSAMGVMQHHDAITGTEKQHVAHDYERIVSVAVDDALSIASQALNKMMKPEVDLSYQRCQLNQTQCSVSEDSNAFIVTYYNNLVIPREEMVLLTGIPVVDAKYTVYDENGNIVPSLLRPIMTPYLNIPTRKSKATHVLDIPLTTTPGLGYKSYYIKKTSNKQKRDANKRRVHDYYTNINDYWKDIRDKTEVYIKNVEADSYLPKLSDYANIHIPDRDNKLEAVETRDYDKNLNWDVLKDGKEAHEIKHDISEASKKFIEDSMRTFKKERKVVFPSLNDDEMRMLSDDPMVVERPQDIVLENEFITLTIDNRTGWMHYLSKTDGIEMDIHAYIWYYIGCEGNNMAPANRSSGAYIFRPNMTSSPVDPISNLSIGNITKSPNKQEIYVQYDDSASFILGLNKDKMYYSTMIHSEEGREYVFRFHSALNNAGVYYTDSNGRQMLKRIRDKRPQWNLTLAEPIPGNYYPVASEIYIENDDVRLALSVDRPKGGASLRDGSVEVMLQRRLKHDDAFGVGEALNETADGKSLYTIDYLMLQVVPKKNKLQLLKSAEANHAFTLPINMFFADATGLTLEQFKKMNNRYSFLKTDLPLGAHLLTLEPWADGQALIRLENFLEKSLSPEAISVDLSAIFKTIEIKSVQETTLAANRLLSDYKQWDWNTEVEFSRSFNEEYRGGDVERAKQEVPVPDDGLVIRLKPKQIRTFIADYKVVS